MQSWNAHEVIYDKKKHRITYNCTVKRPTHRNGKYLWLNHTEECPLGVLCQPDTKMEPTVYVKSTEKGFIRHCRERVLNSKNS
jgi:hypothetical protein